VAAEAVMAVRGFVVGPLGADQQTMFTQHRKQPVPAQLQSVFRLPMEQVMQLAGAQARLAPANLLHEIHDALSLYRARRLRLMVLVIRLAAVSEELASPADRQSGDGLLREDLPERFFTTETP